MLRRATAAGVTLAVLAAPGVGDLNATDAADTDAASGPAVVSTEYLGPFAGEGAPLHPDNEAPHRIAFYGTDLGFTYRHGDALQILFGDSWATESYAPIEASTGSRFDDGFGGCVADDTVLADEQKRRAPVPAGQDEDRAAERDPFEPDVCWLRDARVDPAAQFRFAGATGEAELGEH